MVPLRSLFLFMDRLPGVVHATIRLTRLRGQDSYATKREMVGIGLRYRSSDTDQASKSGTIFFLVDSGLAWSILCIVIRGI